MNAEEPPEITAEALLILREDDDALRLITDKLRVREMGPADHIRTKHEVKAFLASSNFNAANNLIEDAKKRIATQRLATNKLNVTQVSRIAQ